MDGKASVTQAERLIGNIRKNACSASGCWQSLDKIGHKEGAAKIPF